ncbi:MAG: DUF3098 domain-containing protein [Flavisolibacter sp.]
MKQTKTAPAKTASKKKTVPSAGIGSLFDKGNMMWMLIGLGIMAVGFLLMAGGRSNDPNVFDKSQVYSTMRITIAPIIILAGLVVEFFAIFRRPKNS